MNLSLKECMFCKERKPISMFNKNTKAPDGHWAWCKVCEKRSGFYEKKREIENDAMRIVSFSGGKDSTAMLLKLIEEKRRVDKVIYFDCGSFEWPQMAEHINLVEKNTGIKIQRVKHKVDFYDMAKTLQPNNKEINGWPTPMMRWCTLLKLLTIRQALREYRPYIFYFGFAVDEPKRVIKAAQKGFHVTHDHFQSNEYPLVEWGMTEKDCLKYCFDRGYRWSGLYDHFSRVSCWCCPLQNQTDLAKLCKYYPDMWKKLKAWNEEMPKPYKNDPGIFDKMERRVYFPAVSSEGGKP
ncbi:MAG TPA: phosphoadenosine phosphosulfate reductase family protein [Patescibacteria group bacterium]|nr:phosphoadenosine phosphosulfate reductase family protein [Patescibacteria group bacterium]